MVNLRGKRNEHNTSRHNCATPDWNFPYFWLHQFIRPHFVHSLILCGFFVFTTYNANAISSGLLIMVATVTWIGVNIFAINLNLTHLLKAEVKWVSTWEAISHKNQIARHCDENSIYFRMPEIVNLHIIFCMSYFHHNIIMFGIGLKTAAIFTILSKKVKRESSMAWSCLPIISYHVNEFSIQNTNKKRQRNSNVHIHTQISNSKSWESRCIRMKCCPCARNLVATDSMQPIHLTFSKRHLNIVYKFRLSLFDTVAKENWG